MKLKIALGITILIYILLILNLEFNKILFGYLCAVDYIIMSILFVLIFKKSNDSESTNTNQNDSK